MSVGLDNKRGNRELIPIGWALSLVLGAAVGIAGMLLWLAWALLGAPAFTREQVDLSAYLDIIKIVLAVVAGIGGVVALVVAYRRQRTGERAEQRENTRLLNERFDIASEKLGSDKPAVRLAGVHAMTNLADDWDDREARQMCIDVLCSYLRLVNDGVVSEDGQGAEQNPAAPRTPPEDRGIRHTILRTIAAHLRKNGTSVSWSGHDFDLRGITVDLDLDFSGAHFLAGTINLDDARFIAGATRFNGVMFAGGDVSFHRAEFSGGQIGFLGARFCGGNVSFRAAKCAAGQIAFIAAEFTASYVTFDDAVISGTTMPFDNAELCGGNVSFRNATLGSGCVSFHNMGISGGRLRFSDAIWSEPPPGLPSSAPGLSFPTDTT